MIDDTEEQTRQDREHLATRQEHSETIEPAASQNSPNVHNKRAHKNAQFQLTKTKNNPSPACKDGTCNRDSKGNETSKIS